VITNAERKLKAELIAALSPAVVKLIGMSMNGIIAALTALYAEASSHDLKANRDTLEEPLYKVSEEDVAAIIATHRHAHAYASSHGYAIPMDVQVSKLKAAAAPFTEELGTELRLWKAANPKPLDQTFENLAAVLLS
jgi:hypothetical protein